ncbi:MAG: DNA polymerase III subunit beta [Planctomycetota bacterium]
MKIHCDKTELAERLQGVGNIVASASTPKPILRDFLLIAENDEFRVEATDLDISARVTIERVEIQEEGRVAVDASRLLSLVREVPGNSIGLESTEDQALQLKTEGYEFRLLADDPLEFPEIQRFEIDSALDFPREKFLEMLRRVGVAACRDSSRYQLTGVFFEIEGEKLSMTATDGKRLTHDVLRIDNPQNLAITAIVPNRAVDSLIKVLGAGDDTVRVALGETEIQVNFGYGELSAKLIEGTYPDYQAAIPTERRSKVLARRQELLSAVRSASLVADRETSTIVFRFENDALVLESQASDIGESHIQIPSALEGEPIEIRFNPVFFIDALRTVNEEQIRLEFCGPERPGTIRGGVHYRHMLMPLVSG